MIKLNRPPIGAGPGTLAIDESLPEPRLHVMRYGEYGMSEAPLLNLNAIDELEVGDDILWLDVQGLGNRETLEAIGERFSLHALILEDVVHIPQRPKVERYGNQLFVVTRMVLPAERLQIEQISIVAGESWILTFQESYGDCLEAVRRRLRDPESLIRSRGTGFLLYAVVDAIVDGYFPVSEDLGDQLETLEAEILDQANDQTLGKVNSVKSELVRLRRALRPQREMLSELNRLNVPILDGDTTVYLRDTLDHCIQLAEINESYRDIASGLMNLYMTAISNRMNEIMKVLTIMASIFIPLTFLAGIYGMNFEHMPELHFRWSYPALLTTMVLTAAFMVRFFYRKGWLGK